MQAPADPPLSARTGCTTLCWLPLLLEPRHLKRYIAAMALEFEWDAAKAEANQKKHDVSFEEASTVFGDPLSVTVADPDHSAREQRLLILGRSASGRLLVVAHVERGERIRLISARTATPRERIDYEETLR